MDMDAVLENPIDLSAEAVLELEELRQGQRQSAPAMNRLFDFLRTPPSSTPSFNGRDSVSMLADVRAYAVVRDALPPRQLKTSAFNRAEFVATVEKYLSDLEEGVGAGSKTKLEEAKRFCLALNENLLLKRTHEIYLRRERADSRYVSHDAPV